jgi:UDP-N-acetylmuramate dehydrogenase
MMAMSFRAEAAIPPLDDLAGITAERNASLAPYTRFGLGGPSWLVATARQESDFMAAYARIRRAGLPLIVFGGGTNLVVSDKGYAGVVLRFQGGRMSRFGERVFVESGADLETLVDHNNAHGLAGTECLKRIPGWVGAAIYGNAGAYGQEIANVVETVRYFDGCMVREIARGECGFAYRTSGFKRRKDWVILSATLALEPGDAIALTAKSEEIRAIRDAKFPPEMRCAGSIFKNLLWDALPGQAQRRVPSGQVKGGKVAAGWFLEQVGAKGEHRGGIRVADYHANLIYNAGGGTARELAALIDDLGDRVLREFGIRLEEEVQFVGFENRTNH